MCESQLDWQFRQLRVHHRTRQHLEGTRSSAVAAAAELAGELHHLRSGREKPTKPTDLRPWKGFPGPSRSGSEALSAPVSR